MTWQPNTIDYSSDHWIKNIKFYDYYLRFIRFTIFIPFLLLCYSNTFNCFLYSIDNMHSLLLGLSSWWLWYSGSNCIRYFKFNKRFLCFKFKQTNGNWEVEFKLNKNKRICLLSKWNGHQPLLVKRFTKLLSKPLKLTSNKKVYKRI